MSTTLLLHGGRLRISDSRNDAYFERLTQDLEDEDEVLFVGFARRDEDDREIAYERDKALILNQTDKQLKVIYATYDGFEDQLQSAKAVHITGGEAPLLVSVISRYSNFLSLLDNKVVGGSSAGACLFSTLYWYGEEDKTHDGLATLPIALFVHSGSKEYNATQDKLDEFKLQAKNLDLIALNECEWVERDFA